MAAGIRNPDWRDGGHELHWKVYARNKRSIVLNGTTVAPGKSVDPPFEGVEPIEVLRRIPSLEVSGASAIELAPRQPLEGIWRGDSAVPQVCPNTRSQFRKQIFSISGSP